MFHVFTIFFSVLDVAMGEYGANVNLLAINASNKIKEELSGVSIGWYYVFFQMVLKTSNCAITQ